MERRGGARLLYVGKSNIIFDIKTCRMVNKFSYIKICDTWILMPAYQTMNHDVMPKSIFMNDYMTAAELFWFLNGFIVSYGLICIHIAEYVILLMLYFVSVFLFDRQTSENHIA